VVPDVYDHRRYHPIGEINDSSFGARVGEYFHFSFNDDNRVYVKVSKRSAEVDLIAETLAEI
jgi:hypothetical protein